MSDVAHNKSFGSGLTAKNEMCKRLDYILDNIFVLFYRSDFCIESLTGYENMT